MHYILAVRLSRFYTSELLGQRPDLDSGPLVITREGHVWDADRWALDRGVNFGMPQSQARAILTHAQFVAYEPDPYVAANRKWLDTLIPYTDVIQPVHPHLAFLDLSLHPNPSRLLDQLHLDLQQAVQGDIHLGIGRSKWIAELGTYRGLRPSAVHQPLEYLRLLPVADLTPVSPSAQERLRFLGYSTVGDLQTLSYEVLHKQFAEEARLIYESARGIGLDPVLAHYPERSISQQLRFESPIDNTEQLDEALDHLAKRLSYQLSQNDAQAFEVFISLEPEDAPIRTYQRTFTKPIYGRKNLLFTLHLMLDDQLEQPISHLRITLPRLKKQRGFQANLMRQDARSRSFAIEQTRRVFGENSIQLASEIKIPWDQKFLQIWERSLGHA